MFLKKTFVDLAKTFVDQATNNREEKGEKKICFNDYNVNILFLKINSSH